MGWRTTVDRYEIRCQAPFSFDGLLREQEPGREKLFVNARLLALLTTEAE